MFINTAGGLPEQHNPDGGKLNLQQQPHHHHGPGHPQLGQHHLPHRSRRLTARGPLLFPDPRHRGRLSPAALLLKPGPPQTSPLLCLNATPRVPSHHHTQSSLSLLSQRPPKLTRTDSTTLLLSNTKTKICINNSRHFL